MAPIKNGRVLYNEFATGFPIPGKNTVYDTSQTIDLDTVPLNGGVLLKVLYLSVDPYLRFKMRDPKVEKNIPQFKLGEPIESSGVGIVLRSENPVYKAGDHIYIILCCRAHLHYIVWSADKQSILLENKENIPWSLYIGVAGLPGQTAYCGWKKFAKFNKGDTFFITTAAGPVGATVVQLAKADGLRVIASAGSKSKVDFVKSLGADVVFNYKETDTREVLAKEGPINLYWDHVGGNITDAVLENAARGLTIIVCGSISSYNNPSPMYRHNLIFERDVTIYGFMVTTIFVPYLADFYNEIPKAIASGKLKYREQITQGLENFGQVLFDVQKGLNEGKAVIQVAKDT
ncbi:hypothetical protein EUX98_g1939 [Antrodiella citrinella]|uniref:Enoyl reductase (ER) domain-containing protein n=1 Tax=Antrodiella citrinella TaxID=2447956 RepID=A0A4S4N8L4_9APHY|nr:hypothetical protein EUX98_g1939 [Antrodiella citrinella]